MAWTLAEVGDPIEVIHQDRPSEENRIIGPLPNQQDIPLDVLLCHVIGRSSANAQAVSLPDGIERNAVVPADYPAVGEQYRTFLSRKKSAEKVSEIDFSYKAEPLRVFFFRRRKFKATRDFSYLGFCKVAQGEKGARQLIPTQHPQKIRLILCLIGSLEQLYFAIVGPRTGIVACSDVVRAMPQSRFQEDAELDLAVAQNIRVRRLSPRILTDRRIEDALFVLGAKIESQKRDTQLHGDAQSVEPLRFLLAFVPAKKMRAHNLVAGLLQESRRH
ncbi:MAG TPA: hypothetical protein VNL14_20285 [Candidatus Acidoferrales bacterium]|nr:hypothetical protein [Candidatus Acidoferrales bacterium]